METYSSNGITQYEWLAEDTACDACLENASNGPYDVGSEGPGDGDSPLMPEHPNCRCVYLPVVPDDQGDNLAPTSDEGDQTSGDTSGDSVSADEISADEMA